VTAPLAPWLPDLGDGRFQNPVLFADYSDPDAVRVGDDYWLVASSFNHVPGLPILHSRDLVNWTLVNHALPTLGAAEGIPAGHFDTPRHGGGVWAPSLRHHAGKFWLYYPDPDFGIYVVTASDPRGAWSAPLRVKAGLGLIDPCPLWDDDGRVYLVHGWAMSRSGKKNLLQLNELSADGTRVLDGDGGVIIDENNSSRGFNTLEGPKFYKRGDTYWIFAPVGGVATGAQAVYRSKSIRGPYEARIVLSQGATLINGPHQGAVVDTPSGEHWFVHFQDRGAFGRIVHLQPMAWRADGWPAIGTAVATGAENGEPVFIHVKPSVSVSPVAAPATSDDFDSPRLGLQWQWQANPRAAWYSLTARPGSLRLAAVVAPSTRGYFDAPHLLLQKFPAPTFTATALLDFYGSREGDEAGLIVFGGSYAWIGLRRPQAGVSLIQISHPEAHRSSLPVASAAIAAPSEKIFLRVAVSADSTCRFAFSVNGHLFTDFGSELQATAGKWVGAKIGLFASADSAQVILGYADFDFLRVTLDASHCAE
jgi:beta-xylosidase